MNLEEKQLPTDDPRRRKWLGYFRRIGDLYGLKDWVIEMGNEEPNDKNANASVFIPAGRRMAWIRLSQNFITDNPEQQRICTLHELTHCHTSMCYGFVQGHIDDQYKAIHTNLQEYGIDSISTAIAQFFPLPTEEERGLV